MSKSTSDQTIERYVAVLRDKSEAERGELMDLFKLTDSEKEKIRSRLWSPPPTFASEPRRLRETGDFQNLVQEVRRGRAVLFIGAGVARDVGMPSSVALVDVLRKIAQTYGVEVIPDKEYKLDEIADLLDRANLRNLMLQEVKDRLHSAAIGPDEPAKKGFYRILPYLGELNGLILTTNWDDLIERSLENAGITPVVIRRDRELPLVPAASHAVLKLHGDVTDFKTLVISKQDYALAINSIGQPGGLAGSLWGAVAALLAQKSFIFVGYRQGDRDMGLLRTLVSSRHLGMEAQHYMVGPFSDSEGEDLRDWENMRVIQATAREFFVALAQELAQFANRRDDLERIFRREAAPFLEFFAPFGAGKHALLDEVERRALGEGWKPEEVIRVSLRQPLDQAESLGQLQVTPYMIRASARALDKPWIDRGERLLDELKTRNRLFIIIEGTEAVEPAWSEFVRFVDGIPATAVRNINERGRVDEKRARLIVSGRYPVEGWPFAFRREAEIFALSPFSLSAVREMVGKYTLFNDPEAAIDPPSDRLVREIYDLTGRSNPGFIKHILDDLMSTRVPREKFVLPPALSESQIAGYLGAFVKTIHNEVWSKETQAIETLFVNSLCVLRKLNNGLLHRLASSNEFHDYLSDVGSAQDVVLALRRCHLLSHEFPLYVIDPVVRRIHSNALLYSEPQNQPWIARLHQAAAESWSYLLPSVADSAQIKYLQEWLYHKASSLGIDQADKEMRWKQLESEFASLQFRTTQTPPVGMGEALLRDVEEKPQRDKDRDGELLDVLMDAIGEANYEKLREQILNKPEVKT